MKVWVIMRQHPGIPDEAVAVVDSLEAVMAVMKRLRERRPGKYYPTASFVVLSE